MVSHPRALYVRVDDGVVHLSGRLLASERDGVLTHVRQLAKGHKLVDATTAHDDPGEIARVAPPVSVATATR
jgi:uncharacterized protein YciI